MALGSHNQSGHVQVEHVDDAPAQRGLDPAQRVLIEQDHLVPEPT